jgi:hypothetical protein
MLMLMSMSMSMLCDNGYIVVLVSFYLIFRVRLRAPGNNISQSNVIGQRKHEKSYSWKFHYKCPDYSRNQTSDRRLYAVRIWPPVQGREEVEKAAAARQLKLLNYGSHC